MLRVMVLLGAVLYSCSTEEASTEDHRSTPKGEAEFKLFDGKDTAVKEIEVDVTSKTCDISNPSRWRFETWACKVTEEDAKNCPFISGSGKKTFYEPPKCDRGSELAKQIKQAQDIAKQQCGMKNPTCAVDSKSCIKSNACKTPSSHVVCWNKGDKDKKPFIVVKKRKQSPKPEIFIPKECKEKPKK